MKTVIIALSLLFLHRFPSSAADLSPVDVANLFQRCYGEACMDEIADYTTASFREDMPKTVWIVATWEELQEIEYKTVSYTVLDSRVQADAAVVICQVAIKTVAGDANQKSVFYLIRDGGKWLIDRLDVTDEEVKGEKVQL